MQIKMHCIVFIMKQFNSQMGCICNSHRIYFPGIFSCNRRCRCRCHIHIPYLGSPAALYINYISAGKINIFMNFLSAARIVVSAAVEIEREGSWDKGACGGMTGRQADWRTEHSSQQCNATNANAKPKPNPNANAHWRQGATLKTGNCFGSPASVFEGNCENSEMLKMKCCYWNWQSFMCARSFYIEMWPWLAAQI